MESTIKMNEIVFNSERRFGSAKEYYPALVEGSNGNKKPALFTEDQILLAMERAERNPEDIPKDQTFWNWLTN